jgi:hypothetical protein
VQGEGGDGVHGKNVSVLLEEFADAATNPRRVSRQRRKKCQRDGQFGRL